MSGPQFKQPFSYNSHGFQHLGGFPRVPLPPSDPNNSGFSLFLFFARCALLSFFSPSLSDAAHVVGASMEGEKQTPSIKEMEEKLKTLVDTTNRFQIALQEAKQSLNLTQTALIQARGKHNAKFFFRFFFFNFFFFFFFDLQSTCSRRLKR